MIDLIFQVKVNESVPFGYFWLSNNQGARESCAQLDT